MARKPWRPRSGLSGPQPTFAAQGKAASSGWGACRAKRGSGRISREGAFPKGEGARLVLSSSDEGASGSGSGGRKRPRGKSDAQLARSTAAEARARAPLPLTLELSTDEDKPLLSPHDSDLEPDSDNPDREPTRAARARAAAAERRKAEERDANRAVQRDDPQSEMRRLRAEAAAHRAAQATVIEVLDTDDEARAVADEHTRLAAGPQLVHSPPAPGGVKRQSRTGKGKGKGKGKAPAKMGKGRRLVETDESDAALEALDTFKRRRATADTGRQDKGKGKATLFNPSSDGDAHVQNVANGGSDDEADELPDLRSSSLGNSRQAAHPTRHASSEHRMRAGSDTRSTARDHAPRSDSDVERDADQGAAASPAGGSGAGASRSRSAHTHDGVQGREPKASISTGAAAEKSSHDEADRLPRARRRRASSASLSPHATAAVLPTDYADLAIPSFVDPRAALAKRKKRELPSPPTSALSSSDEADDDSPRGKKVDEFAELEKKMKRKKRAYREQRMPGYSNPRRN